ncbi:HAD-like domain-containing protein [Chlamydoabsidia padenii]|nr:HAD-like domain-containing protein [Chlamydoabsidia padenii]
MLENYDLSKVKLVASDLDGTLVCGKYNDCLVTKHSAKVLQDLEAEGVQIALASGRPPRSMDPVLDLLQLSHPWVISCNGGLVLDTRRKILKSFPIVRDQVYPIIKKIKDALGDHVYFGVESGAVFKCEQGYATLRGPDNMNHPYELIHHLEEFAKDPVEKMVVLHETWPAERLYDYIKHQVLVGHDAIINITFSNVYFIEIMATNVSKGTTLQSLCVEHDVDPDHVVAFGDMPNDIEMIQLAGLGVAMANAHEDTKKAADHITLSNMEEGVAEVLEKVLNQIRAKKAAATPPPPSS